MEERKNNTGLVVLITVLVMLVIGMGGFIIYDKIINNKAEESSAEKNQGETQNTENNLLVNKSYKVGDKVSLSDSSIWNVLENSTESDEFVILLSINNVNNDYNITFKEAPSYIATTYKFNLITSLNASDGDIKEARLLTLEDISKLSGIDASKLIAGTSLENNITPEFIYYRPTITSEIDEYDCPTMVCGDIDDTHTDRPGRICEGTQSDRFPIRPVITISKKYIK